MKGPLLAALLALSPPPQAFEAARPGARFTFPRDHGAHPRFRTEWWYVTGHLWTPAGRRFGFQITFFRRALAGTWAGTPAWRSDQVHMAHAAITDVEGARFLTDERLARGGILAGASETGLAVHHGAWRLEEAGGVLHLRMALRKAELELRLEPRTPPVLFGEEGLCRKGEDPGAASHYLSFPRMDAAGSLRLPGEGAVPVAGRAWMDHEFGSHQLSRGQVGWDWIAVQMRDGGSLMAYRLRRADGSQDPWSSLTELDARGRILRSTRAFGLAAGGAWRSPASGAAYPQPVFMEAWGRRWTLRPLLADQELRTPRSTGITYWEGACRVLDERGREVGDAYLEQTGYAHSMEGRF